MTVTDFAGYGRQVPFTDPNPIVDTRHRHVLTFRYGGDDGRDDFGDRDANGPLTFAARTTSSIPGVFPPVSFRDFKAWLGGRYFDPGRIRGSALPPLRARGVPPEETWFVDGGVLDNKPFGPAIEAIRERPAGVEVDRRTALPRARPRGSASGEAATEAEHGRGRDRRPPGLPRASRPRTTSSRSGR